ncbi:hypothetical protein IC607_08595 [Cellulomonas sp. JH27-2]|uniref:TasA family protein n=1 Tax=Cellulomonas sp. JH27-2 TaxID=2774139 RepID=UPI00178140DA|nr:hypothetical protein [Cellulomonas sp. JH27-2]
MTLLENETTNPAPQTRSELRAHEPKTNRRQKAVVAGIAAAAVGVGGTLIGAVLTDHDSIRNNYVEKGQLDIQLVGASPIELANAAPGSEVEMQFLVENAGTLPAKTVITAADIVGADLLGLTTSDWRVDDQAGTTYSDNTDLAGWQTGGLELTLPAHEHASVTVTVRVPETVDSEAWADVSDSATFDLSVDSEQLLDEPAGVAAAWTDTP